MTGLAAGSPLAVAGRWWGRRRALPIFEMAFAVSQLPYFVGWSRRCMDGSAGVWGLLPLTLAVIGGLHRAQPGDVSPGDRPQLKGGGLGATRSIVLSVAVAQGFAVHSSFLLALALGALGWAAFLVSRDPRRGWARAGLVLLALPGMESATFFLAFPLQQAAAASVAGILGCFIPEVACEGAAVLIAGQPFIVDAPCAGLHSLWLGTVAALYWLQRGAVRGALGVWLILGAVVSLLVFNVIRILLLTVVAWQGVNWGDFAHSGLGVGLFALWWLFAAAALQRWNKTGELNSQCA